MADVKVSDTPPTFSVNTALNFKTLVLSIIINNMAFLKYLKQKINYFTIVHYVKHTYS